MSYADFLASKQRDAAIVGVNVDVAAVHPMLHDWQAELVVWAARTGRAALWADTGMGKSIMQLEWARLSGRTVLVVAPLVVCQQTVREAAKIGIHAEYTRDGGQLRPGVWVTNYEQVAKFDPSVIDAVVLDEASILKNSDGKTRRLLIEHFAGVPRRLACTATPAPNDPEELTSQAEFLGRSTRANMLAAYFVHDDQSWRLKGHARGPMFRWMSSWAVAMRRPSDLAPHYSDAGYDLPGLEIVPELVSVDVEADGQLFATDLGGVGGRAKVRRQTTDARVARALELIRADQG